MRKPFGSSHAVLDAPRLLKLYRRVFGIEDFHSHFRWRAVRGYVDYEAARTLEVGCNSGVMTFEVAARMRFGSIIASEFDEGLLRNAATIRDRLGVNNVTLSQADLRELSVEPGSFDQALVIDVLEHVDDHELAIKRLSEAVRPGGSLVISVPTPNYPRVFGRDFHEAVGHVRDGYWLEDVRQLVEPAGFEMVEYHYYTGPLASLGCSLYYRRRFGGKIGMLAMPLVRWIGLAGEWRVPAKKAASLAVLARRV